MSDWQQTTLGTLCRFVGGQGFPPEYQGFSQGDVPFIKVSDMELPENGRRIRSANNWLTTEVVAAKRFKPQPRGAVVFAKIGEAIKRERVRVLTRPTVIDNNMMAAVPGKSVDPEFLFNLLRYIPFSKDHGGTSLPYLRQSDLAGIEAFVPPLEEQERIAGVLGAFDDLIETNRRLAEQLAALVGAVHAREVVGLPLVPLGHMVALAYGKALPARSRVPGKFPVVSSAGITGTHSASLVTGPGVVVGRKGTVGTVTWVRDDFYPIDTAFYAKSDLPMEVVYQILSGAGLSELNSDSAVPGLNRDRALGQLVPDVRGLVARRIARMLQPVVAAREDLLSEMQDLLRQRDELLPLLMSGRVRVRDVEAAVS